MGDFLTPLVSWFSLVFAAITFVMNVTKIADNYVAPELKESVTLLLMKVQERGVSKYTCRLYFLIANSLVS